jgi:hypothetical protein
MNDYISSLKEIKHAKSIEEIEKVVHRYPALMPDATQDAVLYSGKFNGDLKSEDSARVIAKKINAAIINDTYRGRFLGEKSVETAIRDRAIEIFSSQGMDETICLCLPLRRRQSTARQPVSIKIASGAKTPVNSSDYCVEIFTSWYPVSRLTCKTISKEM